MISLVVGTLSPQIRVLAAVRGDEVQIQRWESSACKSLWSWNEAGLWFWGFRCLLRFTHWWISFRRCVWTVLTLVFPSLHSLSVLLCHTLTVLCPSPLFLIDGGHGSGRLTDAGIGCILYTVAGWMWRGFHRTKHWFVVIQAAHLQSQNGPNSNLPPISNGETVKIDALWPISLNMYLRIKQLVFPAAKD